MSAKEAVVPVVVKTRRCGLGFGIVEAVEPQAKRGETDFRVDAFQFHVLKAPRYLADALSLGVAELLFAVLPDTQAIDDLVPGSRDEILALHPRVDRVVLQRRRQAVEKNFRRLHDMAVGAEHEGFHRKISSRLAGLFDSL